VDHSGNVYFTGISDGGATLYDYATVLIDSSGVYQGVWRFNGTGNANDEAVDVAVDDLGNVYVTGKAYGAGSDLDFTTIRYSETGQEEWVSVYNGPANGSDEAADLAVDAAGNLFVTGKSYGRPATHFDYLTIRYSSAGDTLWTRRFDGPAAGADAPASIALDKGGNVYVTGYSSGILTWLDYTTIRYSSGGDQEWEISYTNSGVSGSPDVPEECTLDSNGNIYVTGISDLDYAVVKYVQTPTSLGETQGETPEDLFLFQTFPNPFNSTTTFSFSVPSSLFATLSIYDVLGREVATLVNEKLGPGTYARQWDATGRPSGVYFYRLKAGDFIETRRLLVLR
jgi:hypothetical protein